MKYLREWINTCFHKNKINCCCYIWNAFFRINFIGYDLLVGWKFTVHVRMSAQIKCTSTKIFHLSHIVQKSAISFEEQTVLLDVLKLFLSVAKATCVVAQTRRATKFECSPNSEGNESGVRRFDYLRKYNLCKWFQWRLDAIGIRKDAIAARPTQSFGFLIQFVGASVTGINRYRQVLRGPAKKIQIKSFRESLVKL